MKYKIKKKFLKLLEYLYIITTITELVIYFRTSRSLYGLIYLIISFIIIFLLVPVVYNYKKSNNKKRRSKIIIIILLGLFDSFILSKIIDINYDYSFNYIKQIYLFKNIIKPIIYGLLIIFMGGNKKK